MIAWKLTTDFDKQRHLFFEKIETDYIVETYICTCGHTDFIIKHLEQKLRYICEVCENTKFYDANSVWRNIVHFLYQNLDLELSYEYDIQSNEDAISSLYVTSIPKSIDFSSRKVIYSKKSVYSLTLGIDGEIKENYSLRFNQDIQSKLKKNLIQYVNNNSYFNIPDSVEKELNLSMASFFLKNKHLKDFDFYYWTHIDKVKEKDIRIKDALENLSNVHKSRAVKKAIYQNYIIQLYDNGKFDSSFIEAFIKNIKDVNIVVKLLKLKLERLISYINREELNIFMIFLKQHYTDKQILKLFYSHEFNENSFLFRDTISELNHDKDLVESKFIKVPCRIMALHNEFGRCLNEARYEYMKSQGLQYLEEDMNPCIEIDTYQVKLPRSGKELFDWANKLGNCMAGYFDMIKNNETIIYCFFQKDVIDFAVEIKDKRVVQASSKYNTDLTIKENEILLKWLELFFQDALLEKKYVA